MYSVVPNETPKFTTIASITAICLIDCVFLVIAVSRPTEGFSLFKAHLAFRQRVVRNVFQFSRFISDQLRRDRCTSKKASESKDTALTRRLLIVDSAARSFQNIQPEHLHEAPWSQQ